MGAPPGLFAELARWRSKAQKRGGICTFTSDIIPEWLSAEVTAAMDTVGVADAFAFLKAKPETRDQIEKRLRKKLDELYAKFNPRVARAIRRGEQPDYDKIFEEMRAVIQPEVTQLTTTEALRLSVDTGIVFDPAVINTHAVEWARTYSYELVTGITNTTRELIAQAERTFFETPGMTQGDLEQILTHAFGPVRAEMIATTEATRAASEATNEVQRLVNEVGVPMTRQWHTANDDIVCPICGPLNGQPESQWSGEFPSGPPAHVSCRCSTGLTVGEEEELLAEAAVLAAERDEMLRELGLLPEAAVPVFDNIAQIETWLGDNIVGAGRVSLVGLDVNAADHIARELSYIQGKYGNIPGLQSIETVTSAKYVARYKGGRNLEINPNITEASLTRTVRAGINPIKEGWAGIVDHEVGHAFTPAIFDVDAPDVPLTEFGERLDRFWQDNNERIKDDLSAYAASKRHEYPADAFAAREAGKAPKWVRDWLESEGI